MVQPLFQIARSQRCPGSQVYAQDTLLGGVLGSRRCTDLGQGRLLVKVHEGASPPPSKVPSKILADEPSTPSSLHDEDRADTFLNGCQQGGRDPGDLIRHRLMNGSQKWEVWDRPHDVIRDKGPCLKALAFPHQCATQSGADKCTETQAEPPLPV